MDYYRPTQAVSHSGPAPQNYMYQPTSTQSNSGMYYQTMSGYTQQASPYAMQPSVSQGNTMVNQTGVSGSAGNGRRTRNDAPAAMNPSVPRNQNEVSVRMIVDAKYVGAIIGQQGNKIKEITRESKAKCIVDAHKGMRDPQGSSEKVILIDGLPENSSKAVVKILEVIETEKEKERDRELAGGDSGLGDSALEKSSEVELKLRAHNQLVGRLIGKQGATIKKIMSETETVIYVSNLPEGAASVPNISPMYHEMGMLAMYATDRTITVKGASIAAVSAAESKIMAKLRQSFEYDISSRMAYGGGMPMMPMGYDPIVMAGVRPPMTNSFKTVKMFVPNNMVGAIIGSKGSHIRGIMRTTGATVRIDGNEKREEKKEEGEGAESPVERESSPPAPVKTEEKKEEEGEEIEKREEERLVHVSGVDNQIYKAQYAVFAKIAEQQQMYLEEVKLRSEVNVPSRLVGRIIGKGGQNVRELQRLTGAHVKIAEENNPENREKKEEKEGAESPVNTDTETTSDSGLNGETTVRIVGNMNATINVEARIAALIGDFNRTSLNENRANGSYTAAPAATAAAAASPNTAE